MYAQLCRQFDDILPLWRSPSHRRGTQVYTAVRRQDGLGVVLKQCPAWIAMPEIRAQLYLLEAVAKRRSQSASTSASVDVNARGAGSLPISGAVMMRLLLHRR
jgi:hypothetical protein